MKEYDRRWQEAGEESNFRTLIAEEELGLLKKRGAKRILDLGCGDGLTLAFLAGKGFDVTGIDYSEIGLANARKRLAETGKSAKLIVGDIYAPLPFADDAFDAVIAYQVINHNTIRKIRELLREIRRILKPGGLFSVKVADGSTYAFTYLDGLFFDEFGSVFKLIEERTFLPVAGHEKGVVHYDFNEDILIKELADAGFEVLDRRHIGCHVLANCRKG